MKEPKYKSYDHSLAAKRKKAPAAKIGRAVEARKLKIDKATNKPLYKIKRARVAANLVKGENTKHARSIGNIVRLKNEIIGLGRDYKKSLFKQGTVPAKRIYKKILRKVGK